MTMRATWNGAVLAESNDTVVVEGNRYFPRESLAEEHFSTSRTKTLCLWKGVASYSSVTVAGETYRDAAWTYHRPSPPARRIKGRYAFWGGVEVSSHEDHAS